MSANRAREPRQPVRIGARLKSGRGWSDVVLRNVSTRGVMGQCAAPPARGDYVEVRCGRLGRAFEFLSVVLAGAALAAVLGGAAHDALARPTAAVSHALDRGASR